MQLRPDLALPAPPDIATLAARAAVRTSTQRALDALDAAALHALEELVLRADDAGGRDPAGTGGRDPAGADLVAAPDGAELDHLLDLALVWRAGDRVHLTAGVRDAIGPYPLGLGRPAHALLRAVADLALVPVLRNLGLPPTGQPRAGAAVAQVLSDPARLAAAIERCDADEREVLDRLAAGPPVGMVRPGPLRVVTGDGRPSAVQRLVDHGLLVPLDAARVELPREVGVALRERLDLPSAGVAPVPQLVHRAPDELDRLGTTAVLECLRLVDALAGAWTAQPPAVLRAGGVGVRELRRTARELGVDEPTVAVIVEVAFAAGLLNSTNSQDPVFLPTAEFDTWQGGDAAARWLSLASAWLTMTRQPDLAGRRGDRDRVISVLGPDAERGTVPALRRQVLDLLGTFPPGSAPAAPDDVLGVLAWQQPRRASGQRGPAAAILAEADLLGVTAAGGVTGYSRTLLAGSTAAAERALTQALPDPVDHFLVQPDLTVVVPGPPARALGVELSLLADLESTGGANVYRITERTVRRALDAGRSGDQLAAFVRAHSRTPVPQALDYLFDDAARRHGVLRAGTASAYLRSADVQLLARVLADRATSGLGLRELAPTVAIAEAPIGRVLEVLREAGFAPAAEGADARVITLTDDRPRAPGRPASRSVRSRGVLGTDAQRAEAVRRIRAGDAVGERARHLQSMVGDVPGVTSAATMELLRTAVRAGRPVWVGVAEPDGTASAHEISPISLAAGYVRGYERGRGGLTSFPVHRITAVRLLAADDGYADDDIDDELDDE